MNESICGAEFVLPEDLQKLLEEIGDKMTVLIVKTIEVLYPDGDFPENFVQEVVTLLIPKVTETMENSVNKFLEDLAQ